MKAQQHILITEMADCVYNSGAVSRSIICIILTVSIKDSTETLSA